MAPSSGHFTPQNLHLGKLFCDRSHIPAHLCPVMVSIAQKAIKEYSLLFLKIFAGSYVVISLLNAGRYDGSFQFFYKTGMAALATALIWLGCGILSEVQMGGITWLKAPLKRFLIMLAATMVYTFLIWWFIATAWNAPWKGFDLLRPVRSFEWDAFLPTLFITLFISIFMHGRSFLYEWRQMALEAEQLKKEQITARYETLKNQVNPHFLFNSLNVLTALVHKDADMAEQFIRQLSAVYRYVLDSRDQEVVPLTEELHQLESFIYLMKIRFGNSFTAEINVPDTDGYVAPLTLQMLLENAIKHNEVSKSNPLKIEIFRENDMISIKNNLQPKSTVEPYSGVGLENIRMRYQLLSDRKVEIHTDEQVFQVKVPVVQV